MAGRGRNPAAWRVVDGILLWKRMYWLLIIISHRPGPDRHLAIAFRNWSSAPRRRPGGGVAGGEGRALRPRVEVW